MDGDRQDRSVLKRSLRWSLVIAVALAAVAVGGRALLGRVTNSGDSMHAPTAAHLQEACEFGGVAVNMIHGGAVGAVQRRDPVGTEQLKFALITVPANLTGSTTEMFAYLDRKPGVTKAAALRDAERLASWLKSCHPHYLHPLPPPA